MIKLQRPMLAASLLSPSVEHTDKVVMEAMRKLRYPVIATIKKDGIRALKTTDLFSRTLKLIPNIFIRRRAMCLPYGFDMELFNPSLAFHEIESIVMSEEHPLSDKIQFHLLDCFSYGTTIDGFYLTYEERINLLREWVYDYWGCNPHRIPDDPDIVIGLTQWCYEPQHLFDFEKLAIEELGEGICFRTINSPYKQGRSTLKEQYLVKLSRYVRSEVIIVGFNEATMNTNSEKRNDLGLMKRQTLKAGMLNKDTLGSFIVESKEGLRFNVSTGSLTHKQKQDIWDNREGYLEATITIKHKPHGTKIKPRSPSYVGLRRDI